MKKLSVALMLLAAGPALAQTQLSSSTTFQNALAAKANVASPTFTGTTTTQGRLYVSTANTNQFYFDATSGGPFLNFAPNTIMSFNTNNSEFDFYVGGFNAPKFAVNSSAASYTVPVTLPALNVSGGTQFGLGMNSGRPFIMFDGQYSRLEFDSTGNYVFWQGNKKVARIDGNGNLYTRGSVSQNLGSNCC